MSEQARKRSEILKALRKAREDAPKRSSVEAYAQIQLCPSSTSYAEFMRATAAALGLPAPTLLETGPPKRVLELLRLDNPSPRGYPVEV